MNEVETTQVAVYRERVQELDAEIASLAEAVEHNRTAIEQSKAIRRALSGSRRGRGGRRRRRLPLDGRLRPRRDPDRQRPRGGQDQGHPRRQAGDRAGRAAPAAPEANAGEHALRRRARPDPRAAHRADLQRHRLLEADRRLGLTDDARPGHDRLPEHHLLADRLRAGLGEDRGRKRGPRRGDGDRHRLHLPRRRRPLLAGDQLVDPRRAGLVVPARRAPTTP